MSGYLPLSPSKSLELETPHAKFTGEGRGFTPFVGSSTYVSQIEHRDIYVELKATSYVLEQMQIIRTVVPELPSTVLAQLNTQNNFFGTLPYRRLVIEADSPLGPARIVFNTSDGSFDIPISPHFSSAFLREVFKVQTGSLGGKYSSAEFSGAVHILSWILNQPLNRMNFSA